jgi:hypothetical protein
VKAAHCSLLLRLLGHKIAGSELSALTLAITLGIILAISITIAFAIAITRSTTSPSSC